MTLSKFQFSKTQCYSPSNRYDIIRKFHEFKTHYSSLQLLIRINKGSSDTKINIIIIVITSLFRPPLINSKTQPARCFRYHGMQSILFPFHKGSWHLGLKLSGLSGLRRQTKRWKPLPSTSESNWDQDQHCSQHLNEKTPKDKCIYYQSQHCHHLISVSRNTWCPSLLLLPTQT